MPRLQRNNSGRFVDLLILYSVATFGLFLVALGIALSIVANLGTSPLSCPGYILTGTWGLTVGNWTIITNCLYVLVQLAVLRKNFKAKYLMQIPASIVFGYLIDLSVFILGWMNPVSFCSKFLILLLSCVVSAFGVSIEVVANAWMLSAEMTVYAFVKTIGKPFSSVKVVMDSSVVAISILLAFLMYGNPFGSGTFSGFADWLMGNMQGVVVGVGTLVSAFLVGWTMKLTDPIVDKGMDLIIDKHVLKKYES